MCEHCKLLSEQHVLMSKTLLQITQSLERIERQLTLRGKGIE